jgi:hypothetical protein
MREDASRAPARSRGLFDVTITVRTMLVATVFVAVGWAFVVVRAAFLYKKKLPIAGEAGDDS